MVTMTPNVHVSKTMIPNYGYDPAVLLKTRFAEHCRKSSVSSEVSSHVHTDSPDHSVDLSSVQIIDQAPQWFERGTATIGLTM